MNDNKKLAVNTTIIYVRLITTTIIGLIASRYILMALGQSDFGLYSVVGSIIAFMNIIGIAMYTTTRRHINVETGKGANGNPNKIFNISLVIHIGFALLFLLIAETIGIYYINNYLNVEQNKIADAHFVFQVSVIVACLNLMNIPYQGLLNAFQKFLHLACVDILHALAKIVIVIALVYYEGNALRFYAVGMSVLTLLTCIAYRIICNLHWKDIVKLRFYNDKKVYKEILVFNNYTALGAVSFMGRTQGSAMLVNYFFGTMVNGAFAIAYQVQSYTQMFAGNIASAAAPQITQAYSRNDDERAYNLCSNVARYTILLMICIVFPLYGSVDCLLDIWLADVPEGASTFCRWTIIITLLNSLSCNLNTYIQATGKLKWFQITGSMLEISVLPISFYLFYIGFPPETILILLAVVTVLIVINHLILLKYIAGFSSVKYAKDTYLRPLAVIVAMIAVLIFVNNCFEFDSYMQLLVSSAYLVVSMILCFCIGLYDNERNRIRNFLQSKIKC